MKICNLYYLNKPFLVYLEQYVNSYEGLKIICYCIFVCNKLQKYNNKLQKYSNK